MAGSFDSLGMALSALKAAARCDLQHSGQGGRMGMHRLTQALVL
jgi:hypothetical protein